MKKNKKGICIIVFGYSGSGKTTLSKLIHSHVEKKIGSDRIELYTKSYADNFNINPSDAILPYLKSSKHAQNINIEINAGHDLNLKNIEFFSKSITNLKEVSIGHALICESLYFGIENTVKK